MQCRTLAHSQIFELCGQCPTASPRQEVPPCSNLLTDHLRVVHTFTFALLHTIDTHPLHTCTLNSSKFEKLTRFHGDDTVQSATACNALFFFLRLIPRMCPAPLDHHAERT
jgi:hypothetical protein